MDSLLPKGNVSTQRGQLHFVRLAYLPSYYNDCGAFLFQYEAHPGDSEFIQETVGYNYNTKHWELFNGFLSAHTCTDDGGSCGVLQQLAASQTFPNSSELEHPGGRAATYPRVYVSWHKHANYKSYSDCNAGGAAFGFVEYCFNGDKGRFMVWQSHNIGNCRHPLVDCTPSQRVGADLNVEECYWTGTKFGGWNNVSNDSKAAGYIYLLHSFAYACKWLAPGVSWCSSYGY